MEISNIDFDAPRREREKVEKRIHQLWTKWDKQGGPTKKDQERIRQELFHQVQMYRSEEYISAVEEAVSPEQEALIGYKYKDVSVMEFLQI